MECVMNMNVFENSEHTVGNVNRGWVNRLLLLLSFFLVLTTSRREVSAYTLKILSTPSNLTACSVFIFLTIARG